MSYQEPLDLSVHFYSSKFIKNIHLHTFYILILIPHFHTSSTPFLLHFRNKQREIIIIYVEYTTLSTPGNTGKIRCSVEVVWGALIDVIITFICTPSGYNKSSKIKGFQGSTPYHFSALPHFYPTVSSTKFNNFFITS